MKYVLLLLLSLTTHHNFTEEPLKAVIPITTKSTKTKPPTIKMPIKYSSIKPILNNISIKGKIPYAVIAAFWIEETGWGTSKLYVNYCNFGGVKSRTKKEYEHYSTLEQGAEGWLKRLTDERYTKRFPKDSTDWLGYINAYHNGGYWEHNKVWRQNRINLINKYHLNDE